jgi:uncharacterized protein (UPF0332 family)
MKRHGFLHDLANERRIQIVNPSEEIAGAYLKKSRSYLASAQLLREAGHYEEAVSMAYYSMYHGVMALFFRTGIKCENHSASILILPEVYGIDSTPLSDAKKARIDTQYYVDSTATRRDVEELIHTALRFNAHLLDVLDRITNDKIAKYREKLRLLIE